MSTVEYDSCSTKNWSEPDRQKLEDSTRKKNQDAWRSMRQERTVNKASSKLNTVLGPLTRIVAQHSVILAHGDGVTWSRCWLAAVVHVMVRQAQAKRWPLSDIFYTKRPTPFSGSATFLTALAVWAFVHNPYEYCIADISSKRMTATDATQGVLKCLGMPVRLNCRTGQ